MYYLYEFLRRPNKLSDLLPWVALVAPGVILNKDGSFQKSYRFRGPDLDSSTRSGLITVAAKVNNVFKRLGTGWVIFVEAQRIQSQRYPESGFPNPVAAMIDEERKRFFSSGQHYENNYYLTLTFLAYILNFRNSDYFQLLVIKILKYGFVYWVIIDYREIINWILSRFIWIGVVGGSQATPGIT